MKKAKLILALLVSVCMLGGCSGKTATPPKNTSTDANTSISSPVSNANESEKETLDIFAGVELEVHDISPQCYVKLKLSDSLVEKLKGLNHRITFDRGYVELIEGGFLEIKTQDGEIFNGCYASDIKDGDIITLQIKDSELEGLSEAYTLLETSHEYTVEAKEKYVTSPEDLTEAQQQELYKIAEDFINEKAEEAFDPMGTAKNHIISGAASDDVFLPQSYTLDKLDVTGFNSAYVCMPNSKHGIYQMYFFFDADVAFHHQEWGKTYNDDTTCVLLVEIRNPVVSSEGVRYSDLIFDAEKDVQSILDSGLEYGFTDEYKKLP